MAGKLVPVGVAMSSSSRITLILGALVVAAWIALMIALIIGALAQSPVVAVDIRHGAGQISHRVI
jgi:hypothetical protein